MIDGLVYPSLPLSEGPLKSISPIEWIELESGFTTQIMDDAE